MFVPAVGGVIFITFSWCLYFPLIECSLFKHCCIQSQQVGAPARVGLVAPIDVVVPPGNTGLDPSQTSFFQVSDFFKTNI